MTKADLVRYIVTWDLKYPYDKAWRIKYNVSLFSPSHRKMCLADIWMDIEEQRLYDEATKEYVEKRRLEEEGSILSLRDKPYIRGRGNWLASAEDRMSQEEIDALFDKIKF